MTTPQPPENGNEQFQHPEGYTPYIQDSGAAEMLPYAQQQNKVATVALILGLLSLLAVFLFPPLGFILGVVAIIVGIIGLVQAKKRGGAKRGFAWGGIGTGIVATVISIAFTVLAVLLVAPTVSDCQQYADDPERLQQCIMDSAEQRFS